MEARMTEAAPREPGASWLSVYLVCAARSGRADIQYRSADGADRDLAAVVDLRRRDRRGALVRRADPDHRAARLVAVADAPDLRAADRVVRAGAGRNPVVGRSLGRAAPCGRPDRKTAGAAAAVLSFPALAPRPLGFHRLSGVLHAADAGVLGRRLRSRPHAEAGSASRAGSSSRITSIRARNSRCARWRWPIRS